MLIIFRSAVKGCQRLYFAPVDTPNGLLIISIVVCAGVLRFVLTCDSILFGFILFLFVPRRRGYKCSPLFSVPCKFFHPCYAIARVTRGVVCTCVLMIFLSVYIWGLCCRPWPALHVFLSPGVLWRTKTRCDLLMAGVVVAVRCPFLRYRVGCCHWLPSSVFNFLSIIWTFCGNPWRKLVVK